MPPTTTITSVQFTAVNELVTFLSTKFIVGMTFMGISGMTAGQKLTLRCGSAVGSGPVVAEYATETTGPENADLWGSRPPQRANFLSLDNVTVGGTWTLTVFLGPVT